jgi:hypothetical protein
MQRERCIADPGPPRTVAIPGLQRTTSLRSCCAAPGTLAQALDFACALNARRPPSAPCRRRRRLFCRPGLRAAQRCSPGAQSQAAFELECRLKPGPGHFQQDLPVALRFGVAGPTHALLRELAEFFGGCGHGALYAGTGGSATGLSATGACVRAAGDEGQDITAESIAIAVSRCRRRGDRGAHASPGNDEKSR